jgi:hypothetical protein
MVARQPHSLGPSVFSAPLQQEREGRPLLAEHDGVPVLPDVPQAQEQERGGVVRQDGSRRHKLEQATDVITFGGDWLYGSFFSTTGEQALGIMATDK